MVPKFKAWNGHRKIMADYVSAIQNGDTQGTPSSVNVIVNGKNETWDIKNDHVELLQSTGLKDVNDKNIYEDDIVHVFDVYEGENVSDGKKSMAYSLTYVDPRETLKDEVVNKAFEKIKKRLTADLNAEIR